jgi:hypothetical protein
MKVTKKIAHHVLVFVLTAMCVYGGAMLIFGPSAVLERLYHWQAWVSGALSVEAGMLVGSGIDRLRKRTR